jgi:hypothetical protein
MKFFSLKDCFGNKTWSTLLTKRFLKWTKLCFHRIYFSLLIFSPCSLLFPLFSYILEYLRAVVDLVWICFPSFHIHFSRVFTHLSFSENPQKQSFSKNSRKLFLNFYVKNGAERLLEHPRGTRHASTPHGGAVQAWTAPWHGVGPPGPPLTSPPAIPLSLLKKLHSIAQTHVLAVLARDFRTPSSAHICCWDLEHLFSGMWLLRLSK